MKSKTLSAILPLLVLTFLSDCKSKEEESSAYPKTSRTNSSEEYSDMARIPAGSFEMGSNDGGDDEKPVHTVNISEFWLDKYEVTNGEYKKCVDAESCRAPSESKSYARGSYYDESVYQDFPVIYVSWDDASKYCSWKGKRLPTEAEWEYAARGGLEGKKYPNGDNISQSEANYSGSDTVKVGSYSPNGYGLYDMAGNVWEWTNDWCEVNYYKYSPSHDPKGPSNGEYRAVRGGSWVNSASIVRVSIRRWSNASARFPDYGFRCAR